MAIRQFCVECFGSVYGVEDCGGDACQNGGCDIHGVCLFYRYRLGTGRPSVKLIRKTCLWCQDNQVNLVRECPREICPIWPYRMGHNPAKKGQGNVLNFRPRRG
jgi:hypothetical protein